MAPVANDMNLARSRPPYAPMARPGSRGRWDRDSVVASLRAWITETGRAPRRQDWCGERPAQAGEAQRKWMREHPQWPSSSCVAAHFGSWSAALAAADLPARRLTFETSVDERVDAARRLAAHGLGPGEIARRLQVSRSSVHNYLRARSCPGCGGPVTNPYANRCAACVAGEPTVARTWTRKGVRAAIRTWEDEHGRAPSYREWTPSRSDPGRWEAESPRWPNAATVRELYRDHPDPWNAALLDAGATVRLRRWSDDSVRGALAAFWIHTDRRPMRSDTETPGWPGPHAATLRRRYGSVARAWGALGPIPE